MTPARLAILTLVALLVTACVGGGGGSTLKKSEETEAEKAGQLNKQLGTVYLRQGNLALAKEKLERSEKYNPRDPELHSVLALLYERLDIPA
jgi:type IV pilus assembly protein PilF